MLITRSPANNGVWDYLCGKDLSSGKKKRLLQITPVLCQKPIRGTLQWSQVSPSQKLKGGLIPIDNWLTIFFQLDIQGIRKVHNWPIKKNHFFIRYQRISCALSTSNLFLFSL
jgi:hypothetical protein